MDWLHFLRCTNLPDTSQRAAKHKTMKKKLLLSAILLAIASLLPLKSHAYDFSAVAPSGQTLYYNYYNNDNYYYDDDPYDSVYVVFPNADAQYYGQVWDGYTKPTGNLTIPSSVTYNGVTLPVVGISNGAFFQCTGLTSVTIPNSVAWIGDRSFCECTGLSGTLTIPSSVNWIGDYAFYNCTGLCCISLPSNFNLSHASSYAFFNTYVEYHWSNADYDAAEVYDIVINSYGAKMVNGYSDGQFVYRDATRRYLAGPCGFISGEITIPSTVDTIGYYAFCNCSEITAVSISSSVTVIDAEAFNSCTRLSHITIPNSVTEIRQGAFYNCTALTSATVLNPVASLGNFVFRNCTNLTSVTLPNSLTRIPTGAFRECSSLASIQIPSSVTIIDELAFCNCTGLTSVTVPNAVNTIGTYAFYNCTGLTSVTVPNSVTSLGNFVFQNCTNLTSATLSNSLTIISKGAFQDCSALASISIPNSVITIDSFAFYNCTGLTSVTVPNAVTSIGSSAFSGCSGITEIQSQNNVAPTLGEYAFSGVTSTIPVYIPCGASGSYYGRWSYFSNFIEDEAFTFSAVSADNNMGTVQILTAPTCTNPQAVVYATANSGYHFDHWNDNSTSNPYTLTVTEDTELIAYFTPDGSQPTTYYTITAVSADTSMGFVSGGGSYAANSTATLTATAHNGYHFVRWHDNNTSNPRTITVTTDATYTAFFESDGGDQPSDNAPSIACVGVDMNGNNVVRWEPRQGTSPVRYNIYREGLGGYSIVGYVLNTGATDYSWVDDNSNTATQAYSYKLSEVSANGTESDLSLPHKTIHLQISQGQGSTWNLSWTPYVGFNYSGYRIFRGTTASSMSLLTELSSSATTYSDNNAPSGNVYYQIEVVASTSAKSIAASSRSNIATSVQNQQFTVTVLSDDSSMGTVTGGGTFALGATTTISATPLSGYTFTQWSDGSTQPQRTITVMGDATYTAYFTTGGSQPQQYLITVNSIDETMGTVTGGGLFDEGTVTTIMATAKPGYQFVQWQDGNTQRIRTITVTGDATYTAYFDYSNGIDDVETTDNLKIYTRGNKIVIETTDAIKHSSNNAIIVYDVMGRIIRTTPSTQSPTNTIEIPVPTTGLYMVKVADQPSRKVLVRP